MAKIAEYKPLADSGNVNKQYQVALLYKDLSELSEIYRDARGRYKYYMGLVIDSYYMGLLVDSNQADVMLHFLDDCFEHGEYSELPDRLRQYIKGERGVVLPTDYIGKLLKVDQYSSVSAALNISQSVLSFLKESNSETDALKLAGTLEVAVTNTAQRFEQTGKEHLAYTLIRDLDALRGRYPSFFPPKTLPALPPLPPIPMPELENGVHDSIGIREIKKLAPYVANKLSLAQFKQLNNKAKISFAIVPGERVISAVAVVESDFSIERYIFKSSEDFITKGNSGNFDAVLEKLEIIPKKEQEFMFRYMPFFKEQKPQTESIKTDGGLFMCEAFLSIPYRQANLNGVNIKLYAPAIKVEVLPLKEGTQAYNEWKKKLDSVTSNGVVSVQTAMGLKKYSTKEALEHLKVTAKNRKELETKLLNQHGKTIKLVFSTAKK